MVPRSSRGDRQALMLTSGRGQGGGILAVASQSLPPLPQSTSRPGAVYQERRSGTRPEIQRRLQHGSRTGTRATSARLRRAAWRRRPCGRRGTLAPRGLGGRLTPLRRWRLLRRAPTSPRPAINRRHSRPRRPRQDGPRAETTPVECHSPVRCLLQCRLRRRRRLLASIPSG